MSYLESEPLFKKVKSKLSIFPINPEFSHLYEQYKKLESNYWVVGEIDFQGDVKDWNKLDNDTQIFIENTLSFFAGGDTIVGEGAERLYDYLNNQKFVLFMLIKYIMKQFMVKHILY